MLKISIQKPKMKQKYYKAFGKNRTKKMSKLRITYRSLKTVRGFIFLGSKITADGDYSHEIKRHLLLGRKAMKNLDKTLKSRDITLAMKVHIVKAMVFPVVMHGCER